MIHFMDYIDVIRLSSFWPLGGRSKWLILLNILFFFTFPLLAGRSTERFYCIYCFFPTFRLFGLLPVGHNDWFYLVYCIFFTFRLLDLLVGGHDFTEYIFFWFFELLVGEVKMINFTEFIWFFRHFDLLLGGQTDRFH